MLNRADIPENAPLAVRMLVPGDWWGQQEARRNAAIDAAKTACADVEMLAIVDSDADGRGCEVVLRSAFPNTALGVFPAGHREPIGIVEALELAAEHAHSGVEVVVADLCPDESDTEAFCAALSGFESATVLDHHEWTAEQREAVESVATFVHDADQCATQLVLSHFHPDAPAALREFADVTADHDLWIKADDRSNDLADLAWWADREQYVETALRSGANVADDEETAAFLAERRSTKEEKMRLAVDGVTDAEVAECETAGYDTYQTGAEWHDVNGLSVALLYGDCYASGACNRAIEQGADVAVLVREFNKLDFRSAEEVPISADIAREFGGGGHPCAAGAKPSFVGKHADVPLGEHWQTQGAYVKRHVLGAIRDVTA
jgi:hypothetical protein